jgi:hypothetical protein
MVPGWILPHVPSAFNHFMRAGHVAPHVAGDVRVRQDHVLPGIPWLQPEEALRCELDQLHVVVVLPAGDQQRASDDGVILAIRQVLYKVEGILEPSYPSEHVDHPRVVLAVQGDDRPSSTW